MRPLAGSRSVRPCRSAGGGVLPEDEVVVVAAGERELGERVADARADRGRLGEVERRSGDRRDLAGRDQVRADRRVPVGGERQHVVEDRSRALAGEVPARVVRQVDDRRRVGRRAEVDAERACVLERVRHLDLERAGVAHLAGRARP